MNKHSIKAHKFVWTNYCGCDNTIITTIQPDNYLHEFGYQCFIEE